MPARSRKVIDLVWSCSSIGVRELHKIDRSHEVKELQASQVRNRIEIVS
jgi:hypothetical protein